MKADWEDAPIRVRKRRNHAGMIVSIAMVLVILSGAVYMGDSLGWITPKPNQPVQAAIQPKSTPKPIIEDDYEEQVNRLLRESTVIERNATQRTHIELQSARQTTEQNRANVPNSTSRADESIAILNAAPWGSGGQRPTQQETQQGSYVTVVEETKRSCWFSREGSAACRRFKQNQQQYDRRACDLGGNRAACERANRY